MKRSSILTLGAVLSLSAILRVDAAAQFGRTTDRVSADQVCVYKDINYFGAEQCYRAGDELNTLGAQNNSISSIRVYGRATVTVYEKTAFGGHSAQFTSDVSDLGKRLMEGNTGWSDRIDSLRIGATPAPAVNNRTSSGAYRRNQTQEPRDGICVYDEPNYAGRSECWTQGQNISDLASQSDWSGQISSIRLFGNRTVAMLYQDTGYRGESLTVDRNIPDLAAIRGRGTGNGNGNGRGRGNGKGKGQENGRGLGNWDREISSMQVLVQRQDR